MLQDRCIQARLALYPEPCVPVIQSVTYQVEQQVAAFAGDDAAAICRYRKLGECARDIDTDSAAVIQGLAGAYFLIFQ